jgi:hypothetical protein
MITIIIDSLTPQNAAALLAVLDDASRGGKVDAFNASVDEHAPNADLEKLVEDQSRTITKLREENQRLQLRLANILWGEDLNA